MLCCDGAETVQHFVDDCKFLAPCRDRMMRELHSAVPLAGEAGAWRVHVLRLSRGALLNCILARPDAGEAVNEMEGFVDWLVDKVIKNCLDMMWRIRESVVGQLKVAAGQLVMVPSRSERTADLLARQEITRGMTVDVMSRFRHHWSQWYTLQNAGSVQG